MYFYCHHWAPEEVSQGNVDTFGTMDPGFDEPGYEASNIDTHTQEYVVGSGDRDWKDELKNYLYPLP